VCGENVQQARPAYLGVCLLAQWCDLFYASSMDKPLYIVLDKPAEWFGDDDCDMRGEKSLTAHEPILLRILSTELEQDSERNGKRNND
jgi:hypothetical protein